MIKKIMIFIAVFFGLWQQTEGSPLLPENRTTSEEFLYGLMKEKSYSELAEFLFIDIPLYFESDDYWRQSAWAKRDGLFRMVYDEVYKNVYKHQESSIRRAQERERMIDPYGIPVEINEQEIEKIAKEKMGDAMLGYNIQLAEHIVEHVDLRPLYPYFERRPDYDKFFGLKCKNLRWFGETWEFTEALWEARNVVTAPVKSWMAEFSLYDSRFRPFIENLDISDDNVLRINVQKNWLPLMDLIQKHGSYNDELLIEALESKNHVIRAWAICYIGEHQIRSLYLKLAEIYVNVDPRTTGFRDREKMTMGNFESCQRFISLEVREDERIKRNRNWRENLQPGDVEVIEHYKKP